MNVRGKKCKNIQSKNGKKERIDNRKRKGNERRVWKSEEGGRGEGRCLVR